MKYLGSTTDQKDFVRLEKLLSYGTTLGAASNALTLKNSAGTVLSTLTAANLVTVLGNTAVAVASKVGTATKGATNLPVYVNAGTPTAVTSVGEAYLSWGGKNFASAYGPIDAAMVPALGANRSAFAKAAGIVVEYSRDGGDTWTDYEAADATKIALFSGIPARLNIGKSDSLHKATEDYKLRVTLNTSAAGIYTVLNKFVIYLSTNGCTGCTCTITARLQSDYESQIETWRTFADKVEVSGWSGYNVINTSRLTTYGNTKASQYGQVRFLFECTGGSNTYNGLVLYCIFCFGGVGWSTPSTMASKGSLFSYDALQNATFPANINTKSNNTGSIGTEGIKWANVYATTFHGALDGNADTATILKTARTIWGQSFNGSANVSGAMSGVTSLAMSGALSGATTGSFSSNLTVGGTLTMSGSSKRIYFGTDYIELVTVNGVKCLHSNVGFYSDSFVSAGGIGSGGGGGSIVNVKSLSEVVAYSGSEVMTDVPTAYAVHSMYNTFNTAIANVVKTQSNTFPPGSIALWTGTGKNLMTGQSIGNASKPIYLEDGIPKACTHTIGADVPSSAVFTDTKNTAGSSNKNGTKMFLVAATSQAANPQTYSNAGCYIGTDNCLYSGGEKVATVGDTPSSNQKQPWKVVVKRACPVFALRQGYLYYTASYAQAEHNGDDTVGISIVVRPGHCGKKVLVPEGLAEYLEDRLRHCNDGFAEIIYEAMSYEPSEYEGMVWLRLGDIDENQFGHAGVIVLYNILPCACFGFRGTEWVCRDYVYMPRSFSTASPFLNVEHGIVTTTKTVPVTIINGLRNAVISNVLRNSKDRGRKKHGVMVTRNVSWKGNFIRPGGRIAARKGFRYVRNWDSSKWKMYCGPVRFYAVHRGVKSPIFSEVTRTMHRR